MSGVDRRDLAGKLAVAFGAQAIALASSLVSALIAPKVLGLAEFGYWQLFLLYAAYAGFFHLGLNDGVYLLTGGRTRRTVDRASVTAQFLVGAVFQVCLAVALAAAVALSHLEADRAFAAAMFAVYLVAYNLSAYLGYLFQAIGETKAYSLSTIVSRLLFLLLVVAMIVAGATTYRWMVVCFVVGQYAALAYCLWHARGAVFGRPLGVAAGLRDAVASVRVGFWLMIANLANLLILGVARFVVDARWSIETFGQLSLVFSMISFVLLFVSQVSMVLFPALRQLSAGDVLRAFELIRTAFGLATPLVYLLFFPVHLLVAVWLPAYRPSLVFLCVMFPVAVFNANLDVAYATFFKVLRLERMLLWINVGAVVLTAAVSVVSAYVFDSLWGIVLGLVAVVAVRWWVADAVLARRLSLAPSGLVPWGVAIGVVFVAAVLVLELWVAFVVCVAVIGVFLVLRRRSVRSVVIRAGRAGAPSRE